MTLENLISQKEKQLLEASRTRDITVLDKLLHENLTFNFPSGQTVTKKFDMEAYQFGDMSLHEISSSEEVITIMEDVAIVSLKVYLKGKYHGDEFDGNFRFLRIWKQFGDDWKVIAGSSVPIKE